MMTVKLLGFNDYIPPFAKVNGTDESILQGVNYASGSAGIRDETGQKLGERIPLNQQLINHKTIISRITGELGNSSAGKLLSRCIYSLQIGSNDYNNNYFQPDFYNTSRQYTPKQYAAVLVQQYSMQIKSLYNDGARKFAVYGLEPIGCSPNAIQNFGTNGSLCVDKINIAAGFFNERLRQLVGELNKNLTDAKFTYLNPFPNLLDIALSGIINVREPCCKTGGEQIPQLCVPNTVPCNNRNQYLFWDRIHPTEAWSCLTARTAYQSLSPTVAYPFNIQQLAKE
ncbi:Lipase, GDSL [Corchorus olitorius]|uniref:Lipase, GDSL n=1 Tax=Corchorus olitorius TaxID=93759 RepID=A0A1R3JJE8_9ROSI|nr:Lipase, GDSL [Corchorus olitorius]